MDRKPLNTRFHIHWIKKKILDWEPFNNHAEALSRAQELAAPNQIFTVEELSAKSPVCGGKAASAS
jgi:hypothetical protein